VYHSAALLSGQGVSTDPVFTNYRSIVHVQ